MKDCSVSICVPVYGVEKYIEKCARSLFAQTYQNLEFVFVNDCTKDKSIDVLYKVIEDYPTRKAQVKIISHEVNKGLAAARNTALENSSGEFIMWVDSDDYIDIDTVESVLLEQEKDDSDIVSFGVSREYKNRTVIQLPPKCRDKVQMTQILLARNGFVAVCSRLIRRSLYIENAIKSQVGLNMAEDYSVIPFLTYYAKKISFVLKPMYHYNLSNENSYVNNISKASLDQLWSVYDILYEFFGNIAGYGNSLAIANIKISVLSLIVCAKNRLGRNVFKECRSRLIDYRNWIHEISFKDRIVLKIPNYSILCIYVNVGRRISGLLHKIICK